MFVWGSKINWNKQKKSLPFCFDHAFISCPVCYRHIRTKMAGNLLRIFLHLCFAKYHVIESCRTRHHITLSFFFKNLSFTYNWTLRKGRSEGVRSTCVIWSMMATKWRLDHTSKSSQLHVYVFFLLISSEGKWQSFGGWLHFILVLLLCKYFLERWQQ